MQAIVQMGGYGLVFGAEGFSHKPNHCHMQKTIFFATLLLLSVSLNGQSTYHKKIEGARFFTITPLPNGEVLGLGNYLAGPISNQKGVLSQFRKEGTLIWSKRFPTLNFLRQAIKTVEGFVVLGDTIRPSGQSSRPQYAVVSNITNNGAIIWSKIIGNPSRFIMSNQLLEVHNGFVISGVHTSATSSIKNDVCFTKLDEHGNTLWSKSYFTNNPNFNARFIAQFVEGDTLYACGHVQTNAAFLRINVNTGEILGLSSFGGIYYENIYSLSPTKDGNFIMAGSTRSTTDSEEDRPWVIKVNRIGKVIWSKTYGIPGTNEVAYLTETGDSSFVMALGRGEQGNLSSYSILAKIDELGNLIWAYNYSNEQTVGVSELKRSTDGGFLALGRNGILKVDDNGHVANGCCPAPINLEIEDYIPPYQNVALITEDWEIAVPFSMQSVIDNTLLVSDFCQVPITSIVEQILLCQGDSIQLNGSFFQAPNTIRDTIQSLNGGCDTIRVFNLVQIPQPFQVKTISFCPGNSVMVNGIAYTQPDTISQIIPAATGCDTLLVTFLQWKALPKKYQTTTFCPGDTVLVNGIGYQFPGIVPNPDTLPSTANGCDTLLYHVLAYPTEPSSVSVHCPPDVVGSTAPATPLVINYLSPIAASDCTCPDLSVSLTQGLSSGATFPVGNTLVCYSANDICGASNTCCFDVKVEEEAVCDVKESGCIQYEMLGISVDAGQNKTYRVRVTNDCASPMSYTAFQLPNGLEALAPEQNSTYTSLNGFSYTVRNPNYSPFRSVRYKPVGNGISGGQSDVFEYTLPAQSIPVFIKAATRLASGALHEVTLNTFDCVLQLNNAADRNTQQPALLPKVRVFPNPNSGEIFVDLSEWEIGMVQWRVLNVQGQEMAQSKLESEAAIPSFTLPKTLTDGLYFLEIMSANGETQTTKFVLRR